MDDRIFIRETKTRSRDVAEPETLIVGSKDATECTRKTRINIVTRARRVYIVHLGAQRKIISDILLSKRLKVASDATRSPYASNLFALSIIEVKPRASTIREYRCYRRARAYLNATGTSSRQLLLIIYVLCNFI